MKRFIMGRLGWVGLLVILLGLGIIFWTRRQPPPGLEWQWYDRGVHASVEGDIATAARNFERAVEINPRFASAYDLLAACYLATDRVDRALKALDRLAAVEPDHAYVSMRLAETYASINNRYMLRHAREAVLQEPRSPRAHMLLALGLARSGAGRDALIHANIAEQLSPSHEVADGLHQAAPLVGNPMQLASALKPLVSLVPY